MLLKSGNGLVELFEWTRWPASAKINISYSILFNLTTSYSSYFGGKKGISRNKTSFFLLMPWTDKSGLHTPELLADYKQQLVRRILINLIQSTAEIPHDQSSLSKRWEPTCIRTLRTEDKEAFPTSPHTGSSQKDQTQELSPSSSHKQRAYLLSELVLPSPIYKPQVSQVQTRSSSTHQSLTLASQHKL